MGFFDTSRPLVFAHRGGCALGPENTMYAFDRGIAAGADGLELDVRLSRDGVVVIHHDPTLERVTNATGPLAALTAAELARVDAAHTFETDGRHSLRGQGIGIPTLAEVFRRHPDTRVIVEMKDDTPAMGEAVAQEIRKADAIERVCAAGYGTLSMDALRAALPDLATGATQAEARTALFRSWLHWPVRHVAYQGFQAPEKVGKLTVVSQRFIRHAHRASLKVQVWTVDEEPDMIRLLDWGVDGLISNRPDLAVEVRDRWVGSRRV